MQLNKAMLSDKAIQPDKVAVMENGFPKVKYLATRTK